MSLIDVAIPAGIGLLLIATPQAFTKPTGDSVIDIPRQQKMRKIGGGLICVAVLYLMIKLATQR